MTKTTMTNADCIRAMSDEELACKNVRRVWVTNREYGWSEYITSDEERFDNYNDAVKHELKWLNQSETCDPNLCHNQILTNSDVISDMDIKEKMEFFWKVSKTAGCPPTNPCVCMYDCKQCWGGYLQSPANTKNE